MNSAKPYAILKKAVWEAYKKVKANQGAAGVDDVSIAEFEERLKDNLYKIWNRMSSGSYFPPPVRVVKTPKKAGGVRTLGVPTVGDRVAQMVAKMYLEPDLEPHFHKDSYGYRPGKSAHEAIAITRTRCWEYDWVLEFDIKGAFDTIDHELLLKALKKHTSNRWLLLYVGRWLKAPFETEDGSLVARERGTPQGGVISPLLANLFLHYVFDKWMERQHPDLPFCRYADDGLVHCRSLQEAQELRDELDARFRACSLELHPDKTKIVYCKDAKRKGNYRHTSFDFLGYTFRPRLARSQHGYFVGFIPQIDKTFEQLAEIWTPILRGWYQYYGRFYKSAVYPTFQHFNCILLKWVQRKYPRYQHSSRGADAWLQRIVQQTPALFVHWTSVRP